MDALLATKPLAAGSPNPSHRITRRIPTRLTLRDHRKALPDLPALTSGTHVPPIFQRWSAEQPTASLHPPRDVTAGAHDRAIEGTCLLGAFFRNPDHSLSAPASLWSCLPHPSLDEAFMLQTIESGVKRTYRASAFSCFLNFASNCSAISIIAKSCRCRKNQV